MPKFFGDVPQVVRGLPLGIVCTTLCCGLVVVVGSQIGHDLREWSDIHFHMRLARSQLVSSRGQWRGLIHSLVDTHT